MKRRTITWTWENPEVQELFVELIKFPDESQSAHEVDQMERLLELRPPLRVLDLGCGKGRHALELARRGYLVTIVGKHEQWRVGSPQSAGNEASPHTLR
jgi:2-polyprenyl-3-methyl-5-hydroxy-6-metoxy-1,4-benzoquinol methylase